MNPAPPSIHLDIAIMGGGIAGLWLLDCLRTRGYHAALLTHGPLGEGQTIASQGMIHGGIKYSLSGALSGASEALAQMPAHWSQCLRGEGEVNLTQTRVLSDNFYLWAPSALGKLSGFLASRALHGRVEKVPPGERPSLLQNPAAGGSLYRLHDRVVDVPSLLQNLADNNRGLIFQLPDRDTHFSRHPADNQPQLLSGSLQITASQWVLTAGKGNASLLQALGCAAPAMQLRPLKQVLVRHPNLCRFYGHCLGAGTTPRLTISSHRHSSGEWVWYLGGALAETGAHQTDAELIACAQAELAALFPWLDIAGAEFSTLSAERAEPQQPGGTRPDGAFAAPAEGIDRVLVGWPTKLALAPVLARQLLALMPPPSAARSLAPLAANFSAPAIATPPWEHAS